MTKNFDVFKLDAHDLERLRQDVAKEIHSRSFLETGGQDLLSLIHGNEMGKRALTVAVAGKHSILFFGGPAVGKTMLRAAAFNLGLTETFEGRCCPCGNYNNPRAACECTVAKIKAHLKKLPEAEISCEVCHVPERELHQRGSGLEEIRRRVEQASKFESLKLDGAGELMLKHAISELGLDLRARDVALRVARTIANLDNSELINSSHVCEAVNYRTILSHGVRRLG